MALGYFIGDKISIPGLDKGNVVKAVIGALIIALISNIMNLKGVPAYPQEIVKGCIIIAAVLLQIATDRSESAV